MFNVETNHGIFVALRFRYEMEPNLKYLSFFAPMQLSCQAIEITEK